VVLRHTLSSFVRVLCCPLVLLTGRKRALTEGGIRVPGIIEYPRLIKSNRVDSGAYPVSTMDLLPTLREEPAPALHLRTQCVLCYSFSRF
jgi:arylsulfatase A-like enzyme